MAIFEKLPGQNLSGLTSSLGDFPVRISAKPGSESALKALAAVFGLSTPVSLGYLDLDTCSLKTFQVCLIDGQCQEWSESWPDSGMWDCGSVYELQTSERAIKESGSSSWPTARSQDGKHGVCTSYELSRDRGKDLLHVAAERNWPTARAEDGESCGNHPGKVDSLTGAAKLWTTPHGMSNRDFRGKVGGCGGGEFAKQANQWQTPATDSFRSRGGDRKDEMGLDQQARFFPASLQAQATPDGPQSLPNAQTSRRRLNPRFVEWLMGFPIGFTEP